MQWLIHKQGFCLIAKFNRIDGAVEKSHNRKKVMLQSRIIYSATSSSIL